jgi:hypothetical protein
MPIVGFMTQIAPLDGPGKALLPAFPLPRTSFMAQVGQFATTAPIVSRGPPAKFFIVENFS